MEDKRPTPEYEEYNATLDPNIETTMTDDELQDTILEDSNMSSFQKRIAKMTDKQWTLAQRIVGAILGILAGVALFWEDGNSGAQSTGFSYSLIIAVVIALVIPNIIEKRSLRRAPKMRIAMVAALGVMIVAYFILVGVRTGFNFKILA